VRAAALAAYAVIPATFTVLAAWAAAAGDPQGMLAAGLLAALWWTGWAVLATMVRPRRRARWSRKEAGELSELLDAAPKRGKR
jgi:hypothetical protein